MVGGVASSRSQISLASAGGAIASSTATSPLDSTTVEVTGGSQPASGSQSGCSTRQTHRPGATSMISFVAMDFPVLSMFSPNGQILGSRLGHGLYFPGELIPGGDPGRDRRMVERKEGRSIRRACQLSVEPTQPVGIQFAPILARSRAVQGDEPQRPEIRRVLHRRSDRSGQVKMPSELV